MALNSVLTGWIQAKASNRNALQTQMRYCRLVKLLSRSVSSASPRLSVNSAWLRGQKPTSCESGYDGRVACVKSLHTMVLHKVAVVQMTSVGNQHTNMMTCQRLAEEAHAQGCSMIFYPECCTFIGASSAETVAAAQPLDGTLMGHFRSLAQRLGLWMSLGGFQERGPDAQHIYNTQVILDSNGQIQAAYRKVHLFNVDVPNGPVLMESNTTAPGSEVVAVDSPLGRLGLTICYDLRFPELYQHLAWEKGCTVFTIPSAFTVVTGEAHWEVLLRARAIECQAYVIAAAQAGVHNEKRQSYGHALVVDPWGTIVAKLPDPTETGIAVAQIDQQLLDNVRMKMPIAEHRVAGRRMLGWA